MAPTNEDKRNYLRIQANCEIRLAKSSENTGKNSYSAGQIRDLSAQGVGFDCERKLNVGDTLDLKFKFKSRPPVLKLKGEVVRCVPLKTTGGDPEQFTVGVKFLHSPEELAPIFLKFI